MNEKEITENVRVLNLMTSNSISHHNSCVMDISCPVMESLMKLNCFNREKISPQSTQTIQIHESEFGYS